MRATLLTLPLAAGLAFATAFASARWRSHGNAERAERARASAGAAATDKNAEEAKAVGKSTGAGASPAGVFQDPLLREALASADLIAAVRKIMAHEQEDHCADTRLICLVENLPADRLGELSAVLESNVQNDFIVRSVLGAWARRDAAAALAWVQSHPLLSRNGVHAFMLGWTRAAPEAALAWVDAQPLSAVSGRLRTAVVEAMAEKDPAAALDLMKSRGWLAHSPAALVKVLQNWGGTDPRAALEGLRGLSTELGLKLNYRANGPNQSFQIMLGALLCGVFERNPLEATALLAQFTPEELGGGKDAIANEVLARDPAAAGAMLSWAPEATHRELLKSLAEKNSGVALSLLSHVEDKTLQAEMLVSATRLHYAHDPLRVPEEMRPTVMAAIAAMPDGQARAQLTARLSADNAGTSPAWAAELWTSLPMDQQLRNGHRFFQSLGESDAARAIVVFETSSPELQTQSLKSLCLGMAGSEPTAALQLVLRQNDAALQAEGAATLFAFWAGTKPAAALAALEQHSGALDLSAVLSQLPSAGSFRDLSSRSEQTVATATVEKKIRELLDPSSPPTR